MSEVFNSCSEFRVIDAPYKSINNKAARNDKNGQTDASAADLGNGKNAYDTDNYLPPVKVSALLNNGGIII